MGMKMAGLASPPSSWLTAVKNAFRSSSSKKEDDRCSSKKKSNKRREESAPEPQEQEKKREKRRWLFSKSVTKLNAEQRHAIAVAAATAATAEAAAATAQAAIEIVRLTSSSAFLKEMKAIVVIQTSFRGFLARKALRALQGLVKLQALVRGQNARNQAKRTRQYIQALLKAHEQLRPRPSHEGGRRSSSSMFDETKNPSWRTTVSGDGSGHWDERSRTLDEIDKMLQTRKDALMKREKALAYAFSQQIQRSGSPIQNQEANWFDRWMAAKQTRASTDARKNFSVKTVQVDASRPCSNSASHMARSLQQVNQQRPASPQRVASPSRCLHDFSFNHQSPATPSTPKIRPLQVRSASPRYFKEGKSYSMTHTPSFGFANRLIANPLDEDHRISNDVAVLPNYMIATESAKAKSRSQSAPRTRPPTPERERSESVKKRLSYQPEEHLTRASVTSRRGGTSQNLTNPSFKSFHDFSYGLEQQSNLSSYYTDSLAEEISPCSTTDLRRWLR